MVSSTISETILAQSFSEAALKLSERSIKVMVDDFFSNVNVSVCICATDAGLRAVL